MTADDLKRQALARYATALPSGELAALEAWLSTFWDFQIPWLLETCPMAVCNKSRQIGLSHTTSGVGVLWGAFHGELTTIISVGELESKEVLDKAAKHARVLEGLGSRMAKPISSSADQIKFASGGRILALPSTGGRSFSGNVFLDEFAYQENAKKVWDAAAAVALLGWRLRVASTPNGVGNDFHGLVKRLPKGWALHEILLEHARAHGYPVDLDKCWSLAKGDPRLFDQLFNGKFLDGEQQYIPTSAIDSASVANTMVGIGECFAGLDIGRTADRTELVIVAKDANGVRWQRYSEGCKRTVWADLERLAGVAFSRKWNCSRLCVDATGMGEFPAEQLQQKFGRWRVEPVKFTQQSKEELATSLYSAFTDGTVKIDRADERLREDLCSIRRIITSAGNIRYDAPQTDEGHADKAWALALALHACNAPTNVRHVASGR